jgi:transaldolase
VELAGCDLLTISPALLDELENTTGELVRKLSPEAIRDKAIEKIDMNRDCFDRMHAEDEMANEKLKEGIEGFSKALESLELLLKNRLAKLEGSETLTHAADDIFHVYDLDGDGFITREEWAGSDAVFDALDVNRDGKITPAEMAAGLGAAYGHHLIGVG